MKFKNGDFVVHPQHGVGQVVALSEREFTPGTKQPYYEITIPGGSVWVPVDLSISGLRGLAVKSEITHCRQILEATLRHFQRTRATADRSRPHASSRGRFKPSARWCATCMPLESTDP